jgi:hypothetical protein
MRVSGGDGLASPLSFEEPHMPVDTDLEEIQAVIAALPVEQQVQIELYVKILRNFLNTWGPPGVIALSLVGVQLAAEE